MLRPRSEMIAASDHVWDLTLYESEENQPARPTEPHGRGLQRMNVPASGLFFVALWAPGNLDLLLRNPCLVSSTGGRIIGIVSSTFQFRYWPASVNLRTAKILWNVLQPSLPPRVAGARGMLMAQTFSAAMSSM
jgi:hypothetical protein